MERREALRLMGAASVFSVLSSDIFTATLQAQLAANKSGALRTLSPAQNEIVLAMSDAMIPATDTPGAKAAKVNEFVDLILTDWAVAAPGTTRPSATNRPDHNALMTSPHTRSNTRAER